MDNIFLLTETKTMLHSFHKWNVLVELKKTSLLFQNYNDKPVVDDNII